MPRSRGDQDTGGQTIVEWKTSVAMGLAEGNRGRVMHPSRRSRHVIRTVPPQTLSPTSHVIILRTRDGIERTGRLGVRHRQI